MGGVFIYEVEHFYVHCTQKRTFVLGKSAISPATATAGQFAPLRGLPSREIFEIFEILENYMIFVFVLFFENFDFLGQNDTFDFHFSKCSRFFIINIFLNSLKNLS